MSELTERERANVPNLFIETHKQFDKQQYQRDYNKSAKGKASRKKYRHDNSKHTTDAKYLSKRFVAIDGEGINIRSGARKGDHLYVMLAISDKQPLINREGLGTKEILDYLWNNLRPADINVIYGGSYDFNLWIRDLIEDELRLLYKSSYGTPPIWYQGYGLRWIKGKAFEITDGTTTIIINDVISFFQRPFIQACDEYLEEYEGRAQLVKEKARRGNFTANELDSISDYNQLELRLLVALCNELRLRLNKVGLRPRRWNSPGAIASALFIREKVKKHRNENLPEPVMQAARFAYAGGRFEMIKYGAVRKPVYEYDINSAYPRALIEAPSLKGGTWKHHNSDIGDKPFALYRIKYSGTNMSIPNPVFVRSENGTISYPLNAINWVWSPEMEVLREYCKQIEGASYEVLEVWEYSQTEPVYPFAFIAPLYDKRQKLKALGDGAHVGIKLGLNSIYGKLAQQVGWKEATDKYPARVPTYHQLEWAGFVTSWCRAHVLRAALTNIHSVIAFETDALFTSEPLNVDISTELGAWSLTEFKSLTYVQSGHYYGTEKTKKGDKQIIKCRGVDKGTVTRRSVETALLQPEANRTLVAPLTRFYGAGIALARGVSEYWCKWLTEPKTLKLMPTGKRVHGNCFCTSEGLQRGVWHLTYCPVVGGTSHEYPVEWINPNDRMTELSEFRESENYYDYD